MIDWTGTPRYALDGRVATMNADFDVLDSGSVYVESNRIVAVQKADEPVPEGFEDADRIRTDGTIFPGLIELHNHLSYNALPMWDVPSLYGNRGQWGRAPQYRPLVSGPMGILGKTPGYVESIVRFVESKCLLAGVTTSQGIALYSNNGIRKYYKGIIRNVESTYDSNLPEALTRISDVDANDVDKFRSRLEKSSCLLLHLSEGRDESARKHFLALQMPEDKWAITRALAGIHCAALAPDDFRIMADHEGTMIWSPLSNFLLYGETADIAAAKEAGIRIGIGSDWSVTGSKNLLAELKIARLESERAGGVFTDCELVALATIDAARLMRWDQQLGSIEPEKLADLIVLDGDVGDPYQLLLSANEPSILLTIIDGVPTFGATEWMTGFELPGRLEAWPIGPVTRTLFLDQQDADPVVRNLTLELARDRVLDGLQRLPELARALEDPFSSVSRAAVDPTVTQWYLLLDHAEAVGESQRPHMRFGDEWGVTGDVTVLAAAEPLSHVVGPITMDPICVADDPDYLDRLDRQMNFPEDLKAKLRDV